MAAVLDRKTLKRYRADPVAFVDACLVNPETNRPYELLEAERRFLKHAFRLGPDGRLKYQTLLYCAVKKSGKTTFAAVIVTTLLVLFGEPFSEAYCCANDEEQARSRVFENCRRIIQASPLLKRETKMLADRIEFTATGATIVPVAGGYADAAGAHPSITSFDELWGFTSERARRLWDEMIPTPTRKISCRLVVSHAGFENESELLYELYQRGLAQKQVGKDLYAGDGILMFWSHTPIAPWQDAAWLEEMKRSLRPAQFLRMIENRFVTTQSSFVDMEWFDRCVDAEATPVIADKHLPIFAAVDASVKHDDTAVFAATFDAKAKKVRAVQHRSFKPRPGDPVNFEALEQCVLDLRARFNLQACWYDPHQMAAVAQRLIAAGVPMVEYQQSVPNLTRMGQNLYELIKGGNIVFYRDDDIRSAISHAIIVETTRGWKITKERAAHRIDLVVALAMSALAAVEGQSEVGPSPEFWSALAVASAQRPYVRENAAQILGLGERALAQMQRRRMQRF